MCGLIFGVLSDGQDIFDFAHGYSRVRYSLAKVRSRGLPAYKGLQAGRPTLCCAPCSGRRGGWGSRASRNGLHAVSCSIRPSAASSGRWCTLFSGGRTFRLSCGRFKLTVRKAYRKLLDCIVAACGAHLKGNGAMIRKYFDPLWLGAKLSKLPAVGQVSGSIPGV